MIIEALIEGTHTTVPTKDGWQLPGHTGAVTLVRAQHHNILIDTGARGQFEAIRRALAATELSPKDITDIILTHLHLDHAYNVAFFPKAHLFAWQHEWRAGETIGYRDISHYHLVKGLSFLPTPGHAAEHLSVVLQHANFTTVIAGDAINEDFVRTDQISAFTYDEDLYRQSAASIIAVADLIVPGHGQPFRPKEIQRTA